MTDNVVPIGDGRKKPIAPASSGDLYPPPDAPLDVARKFYAETYDHAGLRILVHYRGDWWVWTGQHWIELDHSALKSAVYGRLGSAHYLKEIRKNGVVDEEETAWNPTRNKIANVMEALAAIAHLDSKIGTPAFIAAHDDIGAPGQVVSCANGLLALSTRTLHPHTPAFFNVVSVTFAYDAQVPEPAAWLAFLASVWPDDPDSIALLQEWIGYVLTGRTDLQKILLLIGPSRSGKGTIARLVRKLIGHLNVAGPTLASLGTNFGMWPLVGKPLAIIADARLGGVPQAVIVERLLSISGEDLLTIDRKNKAHWIGTLPTRVMILSNELPHFTDSSGAIANRFMVARMRRSFLGTEDTDLDARLAAELPGILNWALDGLARLDSKQRFTLPESSTAAVAAMRELASPVGTFIRQCCTTNHGDKVERDVLFKAWVVFANGEGYPPGDKARFGRDLNAVVPNIGTEQPRVGGKQVRVYTGIALSPVSPVSAAKVAGQTGDEAGSSPVSAQGPLFGDPPHDAGTTKGNMQLNTADTGDTGKSAIQSQPHDMARRTYVNKDGKQSCRDWMTRYLDDLLGGGTKYLESFAGYAAGHAAGYSKASVANAVHVLKAAGRIRTAGKNGRTERWCIDPAITVNYKTAEQTIDDYLDRLGPDAHQVDQDHFYAVATAAGMDPETARKTLVRSDRIESIPARGESKSERIWLIVRADGESA